jgi:hypothetical protein
MLAVARCAELDVLEHRDATGHVGCVFQTSQNRAELAGSKMGVIGKPGQEFQEDSLKFDVLPLHHSPKTITESIYY